MRKIATAAATLLALSLPASAAAPDLVPDFNTATGTITIKNAGDAHAGKSVVIVQCQRRRPPVVGGGGGCPEIPPKYLRKYSDPAFPDNIVIKVHPLAPGAVFNHTPAFFGGLVFPPGAYAFTTRADAGGVVAESDEANNIIVRTKIVP